jgi:cell division protein FtsB
MKDMNLDTTTLTRNGILVLLLVSIALIVHNIFGQNGYLALRRQQKELQILHQRIQQLKLENGQLDKENRALKTDPAAIEDKARIMHLAKPGEKIYTFPDNPSAHPSAPTAKETSP